VIKPFFISVKNSAIHQIIKLRNMTSSRLSNWLTKGLFWLPVGVAFNSLGFSVATVKGRSMQPTLNEGLRTNDTQDFVLLDKFSIQMRHRYRRGDVVVLASPEEPGEYLIKRLVAIEGDWFTDRHGRHFIIPKGKCWIEGDNPTFSDDSTKFGPIPLALIDSRVVGILWPLRHIKRIESKLPQEKRVNRHH
jgi:inner membrane protease subunit 2